jgi:signal transduction histidine kinase
MMNNPSSPQTLKTKAPNPTDLSRATIRAQLLWSSLFPLAFFGLLSILVISTLLNQIMVSVISQRNTAQLQVLADSINQELAQTSIPSSAKLNFSLKTLEPVKGSQLFLIDHAGNFVTSSEVGQTHLPLNIEEMMALIQNPKPASQLMESNVTKDKVMVSYTALPSKDLGLVLLEPWAENMSSALYYQIILVILLALGTILSLAMLSLSIGRVIRPIATLAENATRAVPGSIFRPVPEQGPLEIRLLIKAFNQMVISLAEQQTVLRQYAHKALLSQEEERQRLSHELHDGTLQDLLSLSQRIELCSNELERNPLQAQHRLNELHRLLEQTIDDVRRISHALRPPILEDLGLPVAVEALCQDLKQEKPDLQCEYSLIGKPERLPPDLELAIYRVVQEALVNIRKHAQEATLVQVELKFDETEIQTVIKNNGSVFNNQDIRTFVRSGHLGLAGMYERARLFGGSVDILSDQDKFTVITLRLPYPQETLQVE